VSPRTPSPPHSGCSQPCRPHLRQTGRYATREKSGIKCTIIPGKDKPAPLDFDRASFFKKRLGAAERFLKALQHKALSRATASHSWDSDNHNEQTDTYDAAADTYGGSEPSPLGSPTRGGHAEALRVERDRLHAQLLESNYQLHTLTANKKADVEAALLQVGVGVCVPLLTLRLHLKVAWKRLTLSWVQPGEGGGERPRVGGVLTCRGGHGLGTAGAGVAPHGVVHPDAGGGRAPLPEGDPRGAQEGDRAQDGPRLVSTHHHHQHGPPVRGFLLTLLTGLSFIHGAIAHAPPRHRAHAARSDPEERNDSLVTAHAPAALHAAGGVVPAIEAGILKTSCLRAPRRLPGDSRDQTCNLDNDRAEVALGIKCWHQQPSRAVLESGVVDWSCFVADIVSLLTR
jgi:hypothetical protein